MIPTFRFGKFEGTTPFDVLTDDLRWLARWSRDSDDRAIARDELHRRTAARRHREMTRKESAHE